MALDSPFSLKFDTICYITNEVYGFNGVVHAAFHQLGLISHLKTEVAEEHTR